MKTCCRFLAVFLLFTGAALLRQATLGPRTAHAAAPIAALVAHASDVDVYKYDRPGEVSPVIKDFPARIYVPNSGSASVDVIDPATYKIVDHFKVGAQPQHIVPSWDLKTLYVLDDKGNSLTKIDPATAKVEGVVPVDDPYNLYFTPDGSAAIVVAEALRRLDFRDPQTMKLEQSVRTPCDGPNHLDYSADNSFFVLSCEFDGKLLKIDTKARKVLGVIDLGSHRMPQDVRLSPDGRTFYVADMMANGVYEIDAERFAQIGFLPTGKGAHGIYVDRDEKYLYISNRGEGSFSVIDVATHKVVDKWKIPGGGSPDMGGISPDGKVLWAGGRYNGEVYAMDTTTGKLIARIKVGQGPHGVCVYPIPGRYSLGHTGNMR